VKPARCAARLGVTHPEARWGGATSQSTPPSFFLGKVSKMHDVMQSINKLRVDAQQLDSALHLHLRKMAGIPHKDQRLHELFGFLQRMTRVVGDMRLALATPAPAILK
jgi:hypothetical protein